MFVANSGKSKMRLSELEKQCISDLAAAFRERFGAEDVRVYGSAARGQMDPASDIDLFIVLPKLDWHIEKEIIRLCFDAELKCGRVFSAVCYTSDDLRNSPISESPLVLNVKREGQRV